jgi:hypothetical protein
MGWVVNATPRPLYSRETPSTHCMGGWVGSRAGLERCVKSRHQPGFDPRTVQPAANRYTVWVIPAHNIRRSTVLNQKYCTHWQLLVFDTVFTALNVICEPCRTTLPAFHTNKQRLVDPNDRVEHDVVLLSATERLGLWRQISLCLPYMAIFHHVYFSSKLNNLWHWMHCLTSSIHSQNRTECQELVTIRRQETRVLTRCEVLVGHKTR